MANLDSILKTRDITLPTKVHLIKSMVFPVVRYGCDSLTIKKAENQRTDALLGGKKGKIKNHLKNNQKTVLCFLKVQK